MSQLVNKQLVNKLLIALFLTLVFGASITTWGNLGWQDQAEQYYNQKSFLSGDIARDFEQQYDEEFSLQQIGLNVWTAFKYLLFNQAKKGLLIGSNGWLFSDEEFIAPVGAAQAVDNNIQFIDQASRQLASHGVGLMVVLIPAKARLLERQRGAHQPATIHRELYPQVINTLQDKHILTVDGLREMRAQSQPESLYFKTDTHWTPEGAQVIASGAARLFYKHLPQLSLHQQRFITETIGEQALEGDLLRFLPLSPLFDGLMPAAETMGLAQTYLADNDQLFATDLFEELGSLEDQFVTLPEVVLLGTSFSADRRWNFDGALKQALTVDIQNLAEQGQGPIMPMANFLNDYLPSADNLKLVIWEIPERYLAIAYPLAYSLDHPLTFSEQASKPDKNTFSSNREFKQ